MSNFYFIILTILEVVLLVQMLSIDNYAKLTKFVANFILLLYTALVSLGIFFEPTLVTFVIILGFHISELPSSINKLQRFNSLHNIFFPNVHLLLYEHIKPYAIGEEFSVPQGARGVKIAEDKVSSTFIFKGNRGDSTGKNKHDFYKEITVLKGTVVLTTFSRFKQVQEVTLRKGDTFIIKPFIPNEVYSLEKNTEVSVVCFK